MTQKTRGNVPGIFILLSIFLLPALMPAEAAETGKNDLEETVRQLMEQNRQLMKQNRQLSTRLKKVEKDMSEMKEASRGTYTENQTEGSDIEEEKPWYHRLAIEGGATGVLQASANNADNNPTGGDKADMAYTVDLNFEADLEKYGMFHIHVEGGDGEGMNDDVPSFSVPNYDAYATWNNNNQADLTFSEAFYENTFWDDRIDFNIGKMDISVLFDENEAAGDETTQFLSNIFVKSMGLTIPEPDGFYCPAAMVSVSPLELVEFRVVGASVDNEDGNTWENIFGNDFIAGQMNFRPMLLNRQGNYRFYGWYDSRRYVENDHAAGTSYGDGDHGRAGWGLSFDQEIAESFTAFARYSWTEDDLSDWNADDNTWDIIPFNQTYSLGLSISGALWNRGDDGIGLAFGQTLLTDDYEDMENNTADEKYVEAYYRYTFSRHLALTADFQWTQNPGGSDSADDIYLFGIRSQIDF